MLRIKYNANDANRYVGKSTSGKIIVSLLIVVGLVGLLTYFDINARELANKTIGSPAGIFVTTNFNKATDMAIPFIKTGWKIVASDKSWVIIKTLVANVINVISMREIQSK